MSKKQIPESIEFEEVKDNSELKLLKAKNESLMKEIAYLSDRLAYYESDGISKLYNSLQRKANEMADLLNKYRLTDIDIDDKNSKAFERLKNVWTDAKTISESIQALKTVTEKPKEEETEVVKIERVPFTPESVANSVGDLAGQKR